MEELLEHTGIVCAVILGVELIAQLCPKNKMLGFTQALVVLVLLVSALAQVFSLRWEASFGELQGNWENQELQNYVNGQYTAAAQEEAERYLRGLLGAAGMQAKKILVEVDIDGDSRIVLTKTQAWFQFESEAQRARALLQNALGPDVLIEVTTDGA